MKFKLKEITSITKKYYKGVVHDLTVKEDHSYNVSGIAVHNSICSTRSSTGHGIPTLQSIMDCTRAGLDAPIIADGGIKNSGDIVKALAAGADFVMVGSLFAGAEETPGNMIDIKGKKYKTYRGMASKESKKDWRNDSSYEEGVSTLVPAKASVKNIVNNLSQGIRSGLSYSGAKNIRELQIKSEFVQQTQSGREESFTHILLRNGQ
jgi:IMP dehydrogenase